MTCASVSFTSFAAESMPGRTGYRIIEMRLRMFRRDRLQDRIVGDIDELLAIAGLLVRFEFRFETTHVALPPLWGAVAEFSDDQSIGHLLDECHERSWVATTRLRPTNR